MALQVFPICSQPQDNVHRLGNLVLLSKGKNMKAENFDFELKKARYFTTEGGISSFAIITQVLQ
jgi:hypothetical protein